MRKIILAASAALALSSFAAVAAENFIPLGQDYGLGNNNLPPLDSTRDQFNAQTDIYQSEVYNRELQRKQFDSRMFNLINEQEPGDLSGPNLDY
jgi:hypothetical protein